MPNGRLGVPFRIARSARAFPLERQFGSLF